jgi:hypothetical protein
MQSGRRDSNAPSLAWQAAKIAADHRRRALKTHEDGRFLLADADEPRPALPAFLRWLSPLLALLTLSRVGTKSLLTT